MRFVIVTGLSGAGKSHAIKALEDMGYFCIDNLPPALFQKTAELCQHSHDIKKIAIVIDIRSREMFAQLDEEFAKLALTKIEYEILFLDASDETIVRRYKETRRRHPLSPDGDILDGVQAERKLLNNLKLSANVALDTSNMATRELKAYLEAHYSTADTRTGLSIAVTSFGFKYGLPSEADMVLDVRFLPNPFYTPGMKGLTGLDKAVRDYCLGFEQTHLFIEKMNDLLKFLIPRYTEEGKSRLVISFGCTGGKHRSVMLAQLTYEFLLGIGYHCSISHRDINRDKIDYL